MYISFGIMFQNKEKSKMRQKYKDSNIEIKIVNIILYVLEKSPHNIQDFHKLFKILYLAEQKHLSKYGRVITNDKFIAMDYGPVPSKIYDILNNIKEGQDENYKHYFEVFSGYYIFKKNKPDLEFISESEIECLDESILENINLGFNELTAKTHDSAYKSTSRNEIMTILKIADAANTNKEMIKYIKWNIENEAVLV